MTNVVSLISSALRCTALRPHCVSSHRDHASGPPDLATISNAAERLSSTGRYGIFGRGRADHSALMPANLTTLAHFSVSAATKLPKSEGEPAITVPPRSASRALILGSARPALISLFSFSTISAGVFFGVPTPVQKLDS